MVAPKLPLPILKYLELSPEKLEDIIIEYPFYHFPRVAKLLDQHKLAGEDIVGLNYFGFEQNKINQYSLAYMNLEIEAIEQPQEIITNHHALEEDSSDFENVLIDVDDSSPSMSRMMVTEHNDFILDSPIVENKEEKLLLPFQEELENEVGQREDENDNAPSIVDIEKNLGETHLENNDITIEENNSIEFNLNDHLPIDLTSDEPIDIQWQIDSLAPLNQETSDELAIDNLNVEGDLAGHVVEEDIELTVEDKSEEIEPALELAALSVENLEWNDDILSFEKEEKPDSIYQNVFIDDETLKSLSSANIDSEYSESELLESISEESIEEEMPIESIVNDIFKQEDNTERDFSSWLMNFSDNKQALLPTEVINEAQSPVQDEVEWNLLHQSMVHYSIENDVEKKISAEEEQKANLTISKDEELEGVLKDKFILTQVETKKASRKTPVNVRPQDEALQSLQPIDINTEAMALLYTQQGNIPRAIEIYKKLIAQFPEKSSFFAVQIEKLTK